MIKSAILAAVAVVGIGSTASAATFQTQELNLNLRYDGASYYGAYIEGVRSDDTSFDISLGDETYGLPSLFFPGLNVGETLNFTATLIHRIPETAITIGEGGYYSNGGSATACAFGPYGCGRISITKPTNGSEFYFGFDDRTQVYGSTEIGGKIIFNAWTSALTGDPNFFDDGRYYYIDSETAHFTVIPDIAPVPLPSSAALLPLGLGALTMMRKRRKRVS